MSTLLSTLLRALNLSTTTTDPHVSAITADSRQAGPGVVFAALPGTRVDGRTYIAAAVQQGAAAILAPTGTLWPQGVPERPFVTCPDPRHVLALWAAMLAGPQPAHLVAVTGTNGKTSTTDFLRQIWHYRATRRRALAHWG